ncbi:MAG: zeta toxin family protein, partial [Ginsengibacter sp.]
MPTIYIIAGPNGAGKTTAAFSLLPGVFDTVEFVNADEIARGLSPFNFEGVTFPAGRIMIERLNQLLNENKNFAFETTLSGLTYLNFIQRAKLAGYDIVLFFIWLESFQLAIG